VLSLSFCTADWMALLMICFLLACQYIKAAVTAANNKISIYFRFCFTLNVKDCKHQAKPALFAGFL
jgi:hypothetical protein